MSDGTEPLGTAGPDRDSLGSIFVAFLGQGITAFGGPIAQIAALEQRFVAQRGWVDAARFRRSLAVFQALPGPEATEMCVWLGMVRRGRAGALAAGLGFVLPGLVLATALAWLYGARELSPAWRAAFSGMQVVLCALLVRALVRLGGRCVLDPGGLGLAALALLLAAMGAPALLVLASLGMLHTLVLRQRTAAAVVAALVPLAWIAWVPAPHLVVEAGAAIPPGASPSLLDLARTGLECGLLTFGGAYTALPFLHDAALANGWLAEQAFWDGAAIVHVLPAPLVVLGTFLGQVAGGLPGALVVSLGIFLPAFAFAMLGHRVLERIAQARGLHAFLDGVAIGVTGLFGLVVADALGHALSHWTGWLLLPAAALCLRRLPHPALPLALLPLAGLIGALFGAR